ncbi:MAG: DUF2199 domain-containing protein [Pseudomonadota bacterium]
MNSAEALADDPRWQRFNDPETPCACCGRQFSGIFDIGFDHPDPWPHGNRAAAGKTVLEVGEDRLSSDICLLGEHRFLRAVLPIRVIGADEEFAFGPWCLVEEADFIAYAQSLAGAEEMFEGCEGWVMNRLPGVGMEGFLPCDLQAAPDPSDRPSIRMRPGSDLAEYQVSGISFDGLLDIYAAAGQDLRPHLGPG